MPERQRRHLLGMLPGTGINRGMPNELEAALGMALIMILFRDWNLYFSTTPSLPSCLKPSPASSRNIEHNQDRIYPI